MLRGYLNNEERYRKCFAGDLVPDRRPGEARCRRLLLVRRPRRRRHQVGRPPDRPLRGRERADGAPGGGRSRRDRQARCGGGRVVKAFVSLRPGFEPPKRCAWNCSATRASGSAPRWRRRRSRSCPTLPRTRSGKIMRRLLKARELGLPEGDTSDARRGPHVTVQPPAGPPQPPAPSTQPVPYDRASHIGCWPTCCASAAWRSVRRALRRQKIRGFLHLYIGEEAVAVGAMHALRPQDNGGRHLPRARPCAGARRADERVIMAEMYGKAGRLLARPRRLDAPVRRAPALLRRQRHRRRRPAAGGRLALADKLQGKARHRLLLRRGRGGRGAFHESMNLAALWRCRCCSAARTTCTRWARRSTLRVADRPVRQGARYACRR
jgi:hypothetical protein